MTSVLAEQDKTHRSLALDAGKSFIVQAPAGSGKTELLIQRYLTLLNHVKTPEEILAITFTKKAANEMRYRVIKALKQAANEPEPQSAHLRQTWQLAKNVLQRDRQHQWNLMSNPNQLRVQTIDSLCSYLTRQLPLLSHFGSQPDIADNAAVLYREAVREVLMHVEENYAWSQAVSKLLLHLDNDLNKLHDLLVSLLAKRDQWLAYVQLDTNDPELRRQLELQLGYVITDTLKTVSNIFPKEHLSELTAISRFAADNLKLAGIESEILACLDLTGLPDSQPGHKCAWIGLAKLLLTKSFSWRKRVDEEIGFPALKSLKNPAELNLHNEYRQRLLMLIGKLSERDDLKQTLMDLFYLPEPHYSDEQWDILQSLLHVLKIVSAQLRVTFQQYGQIDFIENTQAALIALGDDDHPTDLALALDYQIKHILVDEFQDTSYTQYQLVEKLTAGWETNDGRTLFVVGDPMQSIYRFREAEVGLFIRMRSKGLGNIRLIPLTLSVNFRSTTHIVEWNNEHFQHIFPSFSDMATGAVSYSPSVSNQTSTEITANTSVSIRGFVDADNDSQACDIVKCVEETKKQYPNDSIAILVRSRSHLTTIIPALKKAKIAYQAVDIDPLASRQHIQDLLSLTCAMLHPADRISWLAVLRAPWCGLSLADLLVIAGNDPYAAICEQLERMDILQSLSEDGRQRITRIYSVLKSKISERERQDLRLWIEGTWLLLGGPAYLNDYADQDDARAFFKLLEEFNAKNQLLNLDKLKEKINLLFAATQHNDASLQIMTIHAAKGLEFDTVILPQLERKNPNDDKSLMLWMERPLSNDQVALLLAPIHATGNEKDAIYEYINRQQRIKADYETDRLFYVAATRAKKRLHLFFDLASNQDKDFKIESGSFLQKIWPRLEKHKDSILSRKHTHGDTEEPAKQIHRRIMRLNINWQNPVNDYQRTKIVSHLKQGGFQLTDSTAKLVGTVTHRILQLLAQQGVTWWENESANCHKRYIEHQFRRLGMLETNMKPAIQSVLNAINNTLNDSRGRWILHPHPNALSEFPITAIIDGRPEKMIIDRSFVDNTGIRWIIDYKTSTLTHHDVGAFLSEEQEKYQEQMLKYARAFRLVDDIPIHLGLYFPAIPAWNEFNEKY